MATRIIITECRTLLRNKFWMFTFRDNGDSVAEIDCMNGRYKIFISVDGGMFFDLVAIRSGKESAFAFARKTITGLIPDAEFKWNVMSVRERP